MNFGSKSRKGQRENIWLSDGRKIVKLNISLVIPQPTDDNDREVISLVKSRKRFTARQIPGI